MKAKQGMKYVYCCCISMSICWVLVCYLRKLVGTHADQFNFQDYKHTDMVCLTALLHYCTLFTVLVQIVPKQENFSDCGVFYAG